MSIKIVGEGELYTAEVTPPHGSWRSSTAMRSDDLARELLAIGCRPLDIAEALREVGVYSYSGFSHEMAVKAAQLVRAVLAGEREVPPQNPSVEGSLCYALFSSERPLLLDEFIESADGIFHVMYTSEEIAWAFSRIRKRGWLTVQVELYGLTAESRRTIETIIAHGIGSQFRRLMGWILAHPPQEGE